MKGAGQARVSFCGLSGRPSRCTAPGAGGPGPPGTRRCGQQTRREGPRCAPLPWGPRRGPPSPHSPYFPSGCTLTSTLVFPMTLTTSPTYDPGSCSSCSSSRSSRTAEAEVPPRRPPSVSLLLRRRPAGAAGERSRGHGRGRGGGAGAGGRRSPRGSRARSTAGPTAAVEVVALGLEAAQVVGAGAGLDLEGLDLRPVVRPQPLAARGGVHHHGRHPVSPLHCLRPFPSGTVPVRQPGRRGGRPEGWREARGGKPGGAGGPTGRCSTGQEGGRVPPRRG